MLTCLKSLEGQDSTRETVHVSKTGNERFCKCRKDCSTRREGLVGQMLSITIGEFNTGPAFIEGIDGRLDGGIGSQSRSFNIIIQAAKRREDGEARTRNILYAM